MQYYPVCLEVKDRKCLVVGGGSVGSRKAVTLLKCGALVAVISKSFTEKLEDNADGERLRLIRRDYARKDLVDTFLVIGATDNQILNQTIRNDAKAANILCNIADSPEASDFILPSVVNRGDLILSISTSGKSPAFAKKLRKEIESRYGDEYGKFLDIMGGIRQYLLTEEHAPDKHKKIFEQLITGELLKMVAEDDKEAIKRLLESVIGEIGIYEKLFSQPEY